jgi:hypothetical protein
MDISAGVIPQQEEPEPRRGRPAALWASVLLQAIEDFKHGGKIEQWQAEAFLFPQTLSDEKRLRFVACLIDKLDYTELRNGLDAKRPQWLAERKSAKSPAVSVARAS